MARNVSALALCLFAGGCFQKSDELPKIGQQGILVSYERNNDGVIISSDQFKMGFEATADGTKSDYLGESPESSRPPTLRQIRVVIRSGEYEGRAVTVDANDWSPIDR